MTTTEPQAGTDPDPAPRIGPGEYPFRGALGDAWRAVWARMADGQWHQARVLCMELAGKPSAGASPQAVGTMLAAAHRRGVLRHERRGIHLWVRRELLEAASEPLSAAEVPLPPAPLAELQALADEINALPPPGAAAARPHIDPPRVRKGAK